MAATEVAPMPKVEPPRDFQAAALYVGDLHPEATEVNEWGRRRRREREKREKT